MHNSSETAFYDLLLSSENKISMQVSHIFQPITQLINSILNIVSMSHQCHFILFIVPFKCILYFYVPFS